MISYAFLSLLNILTPALKILCKTFSELPFVKEDSSFVLWPHNIWVTSWKVTCDFCCINLLLWSFQCFLLFSTIFLICIHFSPWLNFTGLCAAKLEVGELSLHSCAGQSHYHGTCYAGKIGFVLFRLRSELWLVLWAVAEQLPCCGRVSSSVSVLCLVQLQEKNRSSRSSAKSQLQALWTRNPAHLPLLV